MKQERAAATGEGDHDGAAAPAALGNAAAAWVERGTATPLVRWLERTLDPDGIPRGMAVESWPALLAAIGQARCSRPEGWPERIDARVEGLLLATLRFSRPAGTTVFTPPEATAGAAVVAMYRAWAQRLSTPGLETVLDWWFPRAAARSRRSHAARGLPSPSPPPLPAWSSAAQPLAMLRANWSGQGDFLALDHRLGGANTRVELTGLGRVWLGAAWSAGHLPAPAADAPAEHVRERADRPRPRLWVSDSQADLAEWRFRLGTVQVIRTALLLRGRRLALLADQVEGLAKVGPEPPEAGWRIELAGGIEATPLTATPGWALSPRPRRRGPSARLLPLGLSRLSGSGAQGTLTVEGGMLHLRQPCPGRRCWLPLLASWDPIRNRQAVRWRVLTVAEKSRICPPETAFAARVSWGRGETLLIYRSLGRPAARTVLGHQTSACFLVALFDENGDVSPIVKID